MTETVASRPESRRYRAFVSYSQKTKGIGSKLHKALESYRVPGGIDVPGLTKNRRLGRFFIDTDELAASEDLGAALKGALDDSENLIVIASVPAAESKWVNAEVLHFRKTASHRRILAFVADGTPNSGDPLTECFPPALRAAVKLESEDLDASATPLAPNLKQEGFSRSFIRLVAGLLGIPFDTLWDREKRRKKRRRRVLAATAAVSIVVLLAMILAVQSRFDRQALIGMSTDISREGWQNAWRPSFFEPALRIAIAATPSPHEFSRKSSPEESCDLDTPIATSACALKLSGLALRSRLIYGEPPAQDQDNIRIDIESGDTFTRRMISAREHIRDLSFSSDGGRVALISNAGELVVADVFSHSEILRTRLDPFTHSEAVALNRNGDTCLVGLGDGSLAIFNVDTGREIQRIVVGTRGVDEIVADGDQWLVYTDGSDLISFDSNFIETQRLSVRGTGVYNIDSFSPSQRQFAILPGYGEAGYINIVDLESGDSNEIRDDGIARGVGQVKALALSADARFLAIGGNGSGGGSEAGGQVLATDSGQEISRLIGHHGEIYSIDFLPDGTTTLTGGSDFSIRLWDTQGGLEQLRLIGHVAPIQDLIVSPSGEQLASASWDGTVRLWQLPSYWDTDAVQLRDDLCMEDLGGLSTLLTAAERESSSAFLGRPWDVCEWRGIWSLEGLRQALTTIGVRWLGLSQLDYRNPQDNLDDGGAALNPS